MIFGWSVVAREMGSRRVLDRVRKRDDYLLNEARRTRLLVARPLFEPRST